MFDTDFFGAIDMIKAVTPEVRARGGGHIVNATGIVTNPPNTRQAENLDGHAEVAQRKESSSWPSGSTFPVIQPSRQHGRRPSGRGRTSLSR